MFGLKLKVLIGTTLIVSLGLGVTYFSNDFNEKNVISTVKIEDAQEMSYGSSSSSIIDFKNLDDYILHAHNIVLGEFVDKEEYSYGILKYTFKVIEDLKGKTHASIINIYLDEQVDVTFNKGNLVFLEYFDSVYYDEPIYTTTGSDLIISIENDKLLVDEHYENIIGDFTKRDIFNYITNSSHALSIQKDFDIISEVNSLEELISVSDYILHVTPTEIVHKTPNVNVVEVKIHEQFKGNLKDNQLLLLPAEVKTGEEFIIFLRNAGEDNLSIEISTKEGSIVSKYSKDWDNTLQILDNLD